MTYAQNPLDRALITWADTVTAAVMELRLLTQAATAPQPQPAPHHRKTSHLRVVPVAIGAALAGWAALRRHATAAAMAAVGASAATAVTLTAVTAPVYRSPYDLDVSHHPAAVAPDPVITHVSHTTRIERRVRLIPAGVPMLPAQAPASPAPTVSVTVGTSLPPVLPTPTPTPPPSLQNRQGQNCDGILILGLCVL